MPPVDTTRPVAPLMTRPLISPRSMLPKPDNWPGPDSTAPKSTVTPTVSPPAATDSTPLETTMSPPSKPPANILTVPLTWPAEITPALLVTPISEPPVPFT